MTPHIDSNIGEISNLVIMCGDTIRCKYIAEKYLSDVLKTNTVRGMEAYTGKYNNKKVTIFPSGMGIPSMGIYSYELFKFYGVEKIIRIGTCGSIDKNINLLDKVLVGKSFSTSNYYKELSNNKNNLISANVNLNNIIKSYGNIKEVNVYTCECFYNDIEIEKLTKNNIKCVEMECFSLFINANYFNKQACAILTVSDNIIKKDKISTEDRVKKLDESIILGLESITK